MTIKVESFLAIERALTTRLNSSMARVTAPIYRAISVALDAQDYEEATRLINSIDLGSVVEENRKFIEYMSNMAMLFGASRVTPNPGTSVVGLGYEKITAMQSVQSFGNLITQRAGLQLRKIGLQLIAREKSRQLPVQKANPYHDEEGKFASKDKASNPKFTEAETAKVVEGVEMRRYSIRTTLTTGMFPNKADTGNVPGTDYTDAVITEVNVKDLVPTQADVDIAGVLAYGQNKGRDTTLPLVGKYKGELVIIDGTHRLAAMLLAGREKVVVRLVDRESTIQKANQSHDELGRFPSKDKHRKKAERVLHPFISFMNGTSQSFIDMAASLHTSRLSAYGFTAEADALGLTQYQINEQLDTRICPVCTEMHGKVFSVRDARALLDVVLRVDDPEDLKQLQPWPKQDKASVATLEGMSTQELVEHSWHIPPYHPRCRGLLARVGKAPTLQQMQTGTIPEQYITTVEDFKSLGLSFSEETVAKWNLLSAISPVEVVARMQGTTTEELLSRLLTSTKVASSGLSVFNLNKQATIGTYYAGFGSTKPLAQTVKLITATKTLAISNLEIPEGEPASSIAKGYLLSTVSLTRDIGLSYISVQAGLELGGYAYARYGFVPSAAGWHVLRKSLLKKVGKNELLGGMSLETVIATNALLASADPTSIFALSDLVELTYNKLPLGQALLAGTSWKGSLDLNSQDAMSRFLAYMGN